MTVTLTPQLEALVRQKIDAGLYATADQVIEEALSLLDERDRLRRLRLALAEGEIGEGIPYSPELLEEVDREVDERVRRGDKPSPEVCPQAPARPLAQGPPRPQRHPGLHRAAMGQATARRLQGRHRS